MPPRRRDNSRDSYRRRDRRGDRGDRRDDRDDRRDDRRDRDDRNDRNDRSDRGGRSRRYRDRSDRNDRNESLDRLDRDRNARRNRERDNRERERESRNRDRERRPRWDVREKSPAPKRHAREFSDDDSDEEEEQERKDVPNFESGVLSGGHKKDKKDEPTATVEVRDITYSEPVDAGEPPQGNPFHLFLFEPGQEDPIEKIQLDKRGFYRFGRDSQLNDVSLHELSCSKVHAALQFRKIENVNDEGETSFQTNLYVIDLDSTNGTFINDKQIPTSRYVQVLPKDVLSFGDLSTDYVVVREDEKKE